MNLTALFIRRPVMTVLVMAGLLIFGIIGYQGLPVSDLPNIDFPTISVMAQLPGANPETMAASVASPLERQFSTIAGLDSMTSSSRRGASNVTLQFSLDRDIDSAAQDVQNAIAAVARRLPPGMPNPPSLYKQNPADQPILMFSLNSDTFSSSMVNEFAETVVAPQISTLNGVSQVNVYGTGRFAVRIQLDPNKLVNRGISLDEVQQAIDRQNANLPTGTLWGRAQAFTVEAKGQLASAAEYKPLIVTYRNGSPVRLEELGKVMDSVQNDKSLNFYNGRRSVGLMIMRQPGTNTVEIVDNILRLLPTFRAQLPPAINMDIVMDRSEPIRNSVNDVKLTLGLAVVLVVLVIFLFLRNISATLIPSLALPLSIVGTFAVMPLFKFSLDNLSLMALTLAVGFVVDDAIVVLENIVRHMEMGKSRFEAALEGGREIAFTVLSMTLSLAAVFIPVLFMGGLIGRLFHEFSVVIMTAILISGAVSLSLTPMLCSRFLKPPSEHHNRLYNLTERMFDGARDAYVWTLRGAIRLRFVMLLVAIGTGVGTVYLYRQMPTGFIPSEDTGVLSAQMQFPQDSSFEAQRKTGLAAGEIITADPNVEAVQGMVGSSGMGGGGGFMNVRLKPRDQRTASADQVINALRPKLGALPGARIFLTNPPAIRIGGMRSSSQYQFTLQAQDLTRLYSSANAFEQRLRQVPGITDVNSDLQVATPQVTLDIDRDRSAALGVTATQVQSALLNAYGSRQVSAIYTPTNDYQVIMELLPEYQRDPNALRMLYVRSSSGKLVPLDSVTVQRTTVGALTVTHFGQSPSVTMSFDLQPGVSLGEAVERVQALALEVLPADIRTNFQGTAAAFQASFAGLGMLLAMAILVIYMVLGILYESFIHPLTILSGLPSAGMGALLTLLIFKEELNIFSFVGIIMLVGIVKKNAIMMIDFALEVQRTQGMTASEAIVEACLVRFRPIMMTTMAALVGTLPIALGIGAGGEARRPLGLAVVGGLVVSQMLTLYITPVVYIYMERFRSLGKKGKKRKSVELVQEPLPAMQ